jgi:hypothetical protein
LQRDARAGDEGMAFLGITPETMFFGFSQARPAGMMVLPSIPAMS